MDENGVPKPIVFLSKKMVFDSAKSHPQKAIFVISFDSIFALFAKMTSKRFINDSVYKVFRLPFFDTAKPSFPYGKVMSRKVAKSHQGIVKSVMLFEMFLCTFWKGHSEVAINDSVYKVFATAFFIFLDCTFP